MIYVKKIMLKGLRVITAITLSACLSACVGTQVVGKANDIDSLAPNPGVLSSFNESLFLHENVVDIGRLTQLSEGQKSAFLTFYNDPKFALTPSHVRVATYLGILLDQFTYSEKTFTAQQTLDNLTGNCLSLTMLTTALAELVGVDIHYQLLDQNPVFSINGNLLVTSDHLRAVLKSSPKVIKGEVTDSVSYIRIDYFDTDGLSFVDAISVNTQKSLFYSNLSIDYLGNDDFDRSYAYAKKALDIYPSNASALNTMAVLHSKRGDIAMAEKLYELGALNYSKKPLFLRNYKNLLASQGRDLDLSAFLLTKQKADQTHPWEWVRAGKKAFSRGNYNDAVIYYQKALEIAPDIPQVHVFAGQASLAAGEEFQSKRFFVNAYNLSKGSDDQALYKGKLLALKGRFK